MGPDRLPLLVVSISHSPPSGKVLDFTLHKTCSRRDRMRRREFITLIGSVATGCPISALGAQSKLPRIGVLLLGYPDPETFLTGLRKGLSDLGYEEGRSIELVIRSAEGQQAALLSLAGELIRLDVDIIVAFPTTAGAAAKQITAETPIVVYGGDLEAAHLVAGLARPGGNLTGITGATLDLAAKNLELVTEMLPTVHRVAVLANADSPISKALLDHVQMAANARKIEIKAMMVHAADQLDSDFADFEAWGAEALLVHPALPQKQIADLAIKHHLPSVSPNSTFCGLGGLRRTRRTSKRWRASLRHSWTRSSRAESPRIYPSNYRRDSD